MDKNKFDTTFLVEIGFRGRLVSFRKGGDVSKPIFLLNAAQPQPIGRLKKIVKNVEIKCFPVYLDGQI